MIKQKFQACFEKIKKANNILLISHGNPDGDAVSSLCSMMEALSLMKKDFFAFCRDEAPRQFAYLPHYEKIESRRDNLHFKNYDLIIVVDCGSLARTGLEKEISSRQKGQFVIEIDHHPKTDDYSNLEIRDTECVSTTELIYWLFKENKLRLNKNISNCILTGIITDTGNFLYQSTSERSVKIASEMMLYGAQYPRIFDLVRRNKSLSGMKLWGIAINNLKINKKYNFAYTVLSQEDLEKCQSGEEEIDGVSGFLSNLEGINGLLLIREGNNGVLKGSLRTNKENMDISKLAAILGGGGHKKASGFKIKGKIKKDRDLWKII
jgi:bifunctional oligoribonuclease and PAP phosphatase NrnA